MHAVVLFQKAAIITPVTRPVGSDHANGESFLQKLAIECLTVHTVQNMKNTLVDSIQPGKLGIRTLYDKLTTAVEVSMIISVVYGVDPIAPTSIINTFMDKLDDRVRSLILAERLRQNVRETDLGALRWHLDQAIVQQKYVETQGQANRGQQRHIRSVISETLQQLESAGVISSGDHGNMEEHTVDAMDVTFADPEHEQDDADMAADVLAVIRSRYRPRPEQDRRSPAHASARAMPTNHTDGPTRQYRPAADNQRRYPPRVPPRPGGDPQKQQWRDQKRCLLCGAPGPEEGGHWARDCPLKQKPGYRQRMQMATANAMAQLCSLYPDQEEQLYALQCSMCDGVEENNEDTSPSEN